MFIRSGGSSIRRFVFVLKILRANTINRYTRLARFERWRARRFKAHSESSTHTTQWPTGVETRAREASARGVLLSNKSRIIHHKNVAIRKTNASLEPHSIRRETVPVAETSPAAVASGGRHRVVRRISYPRVTITLSCARTDKIYILYLYFN